MSKKIVISAIGGPEVLKFIEYNIPDTAEMVNNLFAECHDIKSDYKIHPFLDILLCPQGFLRSVKADCTLQFDLSYTKNPF